MMLFVTNVPEVGAEVDVDAELKGDTIAIKIRRLDSEEECMRLALPLDEALELAAAIIELVKDQLNAGGHA